MAEVRLNRRLGLVQVLLYGLGVTVGAGIYALVGGTIALAGPQAPLAFVLAALVMALPAACFAELTGRLPYAAAEANFVRAGFGLRWLVRLVGVSVALIGLVSAAAIAHGAVGYLSHVIALPVPLWLAIVVIGCGAIASLGIKSSVGIAGALTLIEVAGLLLIIGGGLWAGADYPAQIARALPLPFSGAMGAGIIAASLLAFFAFIGFEDMDSIAEETLAPQRTLSQGIFLTLGITTLLYLAVVLTVLASATLDELTTHPAPLTLVFTRNTGLPAGVLTAIASLATLNGIIVQLLMAARMIFGMARDGELPAALGTLSPRTTTPLRATALATAATLVLALAFPIVALAEWTSNITLAVFGLVCLSLARIRARGEAAPAGTFVVYRWVPITGALACFGLLAAGLVVDV